MRRGATAILVFAITAMAVTGPAHAAKRALTPDDIYRMESVSDAQLSPDGQWIAYLVSTSDREADEGRSAIWMVSWDGTQQLQLTQPAASISTPRWSPDGRYLAYLGKPADAAHDTDSVRTQVMALDRRGGEPRALTRVSDDIESFAWSPDGQRLVLVMETDSDAPKDADAAKKPRPTIIDNLIFKEDVTGYIGRGQKLQLYLFDLGTQKLELLSNDPGANDFGPAWSPDGRQIAFARTRERGVDPDGKMDINVIEARAAAAPRRLVRPYAPNFQRLAWSPDGQLVAYLQGLEPKYDAYMHDELATVPAAGGAPRALTGALDRWVFGYNFAADSQSLSFVVEDDRRQYLARLQLADSRIEKLDVRMPVVLELSAAGGHTALVAADDKTAAEVYAYEGGALRRLTHHGDKLLDEIELGAVEDLDFKSRDGSGIHGGPDLQDNHSVDFDSYTMMRQMIAARGYVTIGVNYRGSSGRGLSFARVIFADWGHKEVEDLLAGVDAAVARGLADPERLGIGGWSYGGMLTNYTIATDGRFRTAFSGAGGVNALASYGTDQYVMQYNSELGLPWRDPAPYMKVSYPFFQADRIHTPTLFMGGDRDFNVPISGGEQMYTALRTLGVPTQLVVYPDQHHEFGRPSFYKDRLERTAAWFDHYLKPAP